MKVLKCPACNNGFELKNWVYNNRIKASKSGELFCSKICSNLRHSKAGEANPSWKGGVSKQNQYFRYQKPHPHKYKARNTAHRAIKAGLLKREYCKVCGSTKSEMHHPDYYKPLEVVWLCRKHHGKLRKVVRA